ncbi:aminotransferase class V-fold PLP-dependent enzyme [Sutterella sp.]|uniref:aminotransferase class V-fold PLP-dependent enzyme n=1 Tax=Sutterella sp. TaxID=1981025 RepID=UPI0026E08AD4|nr:aminotransferase class V-fold PLP-dependent enzyme [Sutterella sp.]MDO5532768.1 aminotransferase class V-fold PLP-dependent enzyme [Sutterella sp.]
MKFNTTLLHGNAVNRYAYGATQPSVCQSSAFHYPSAEELEDVFQGRVPGHAYTRCSNPTVDALERRLAEVEGGLAAVACASGMAAVTTAILNLVCAGDEIVSSSALFGGTAEFLEDLERFGVKTHYVPKLTAESVKPLLNERTRLVFGEVISNPSLAVTDVRAVAEVAHAAGVPLVLDATTVTPWILRPIELGADIVIHSVSKYIAGSGNAISGVIIDSGNFKWDATKHRALAHSAKFGRFAFTAQLRNAIWKNLGGCIAPQNAYLAVNGLETLGLRMERICANAKALAESLDGLPGVTVTYPTLASHPDHELIARDFRGLGCGIVTLRLGSRERAFRFMNALRHVCLATNIGDVRTLVIAPEKTINAHSTPEQIAAAGVFPDTVRVSVGIEDAEDLIEDFRQAIAAANAADAADGKTE